MDRQGQILMPPDYCHGGIKIREKTVITCDRVMVLASCTSSDDLLSMYQDPCLEGQLYPGAQNFFPSVKMSKNIDVHP